MEFILDGTNLLRSLQNHSSLGIILHLASDMLERGEDFVCYYDHTTVNKLGYSFVMAILEKFGEKIPKESI